MIGAKRLLADCSWVKFERREKNDIVRITEITW